MTQKNIFVSKDCICSDVGNYVKVSCIYACGNMALRGRGYLSSLSILPDMLDFFEKWCLYSVLKSGKFSIKDVVRAEDIPEECMQEAEDIRNRLQDNKVSIFVRDESGYEKYMFSWAPYIGYVLWNTEIFALPLLGVVWPRRPSLYAQDVVRDLIVRSREYDLASVSWGAEGIDMLTHQTSCECGIPTIVVIGAGIRRYMQSTERRNFVYNIISKWWAVYSAFKLDQPPLTYTFPQRNKYIAWMSTCLFVPEAGKKSGSLITVDFAAAMDTPCYSVRQDIYSSTGIGIHQAWYEGKLKVGPDLTMPLLHFSKHIINDNSLLEEKITWEMPQNELIDYIKTLIADEKSVTLEYLARVSKYDIWDIISTLVQGEFAGLRKESEPGIYTKK